jgi:CubicO group peptidase (beta-lactamase class C family)
MSYLFQTRNIWRSIFILFTFIFLVSSCSSEEQTSSIDETSTIEQRIQRIQNGLVPPVIFEGETPKKIRLLDRMEELGIPAVSIAVIHDGKIEWARGFGSLKIGGPPVTPDTLFQAGSISKPVAAMAALKLVESGKMDLDADINQYLSSWKVPASKFTDTEKVTLRRLLGHTAGMTVHGFPGYATDEQVPTLVQVLNGEKPANTAPIVVNTVPGTIIRYAGGGYEVMQLALQDVTGKPFPELLQELVLGPAGMIQSTYEQPLHQDRLAQAAVPYQQGKVPVRGGAHIYPEMAAAGLWTTPSDLARFAINLQETLSGKSKGVLSREMAVRMTTNVMSRSNYGLGLELGGIESNPHFGHSGVNAGFQNYFVAYHNGDGAVIMTNSDTGRMIINDILRAIANEYGWPDFKSTIRKRISVSPDVLNQYTGVYQLEPNVNLEVTLKDNQLMAQATGQYKFALYAMSETRFFPTVVKAEVEFIKDESGKVTHLIFSQGGNNTKAVKTSAKVPEKKEIKEIKLSTDILSQYVGTYELQPGYDFVVTLEGGQLISQVTGQGKVPIFAETETTFFPKVVEATIEFCKDNKGAVSHLILSQGGRNTVARRAGYEKEPDPVDGTWTATVDGPDGKPVELTYVFEKLGNALLGTVNSRMGGGPFSEGKIDGNKISFIVRIDATTTIETTGTVSGDEINFIQRRGNDVKEITAKRVSK